MVGWYLYFNAALYTVFAIWCTLAPERTSRAMGFQGLSASGTTEYLTVYGGLQLGLGLFFLYCVRADQHRLGLLLALALYLPIVTFRLVSLVRLWPVGSTTLAVATLEVVLLVTGLALWFGANPANAGHP